MLRSARSNTTRTVLGRSLFLLGALVLVAGLGAALGVGTAVAKSGSRLDTAPPPAPLILKGPALTGLGAVSSTHARFKVCDDADNSNDNGCNPADRAAVTLYCSLDAAPAAPCTSPVRYRGLAQGSHSLQVYAVDQGGNQSPARTWNWIVDTVAPDAPVFTQTPSGPTTNTASPVTFAWSEASDDVAEYLCSLDNGPYQHCSTPDSFTVDPQSSGHVFSVVSVDLAGNQSASATFSW